MGSLGFRLVLGLRYLDCSLARQIGLVEWWCWAGMGWPNVLRFGSDLGGKGSELG